MKIHELLRERAELLPQEELQRLRKERNRSTFSAFWRDVGEIYKTYSYYWHTQDKIRTQEQIAHCVINAMPSTPHSPPAILDIGTGKGDKINHIMGMLLTERHELAALDIVESAAEDRDSLEQFLSRYEYGGCLRDSFGTIEEIGDRTYDAILLINAIYYLDPLEEKILYCLERIKTGGSLIILYLNNNIDHKALVCDICERSGIPHETTFSLLPLRLFMEKDKERYNSRMVEVLNAFYVHKYYKSTPSDQEFLEIIEACSNDGFLNMEHCLLNIHNISRAR